MLRSPDAAKQVVGIFDKGGDTKGLKGQWNATDSIFGRAYTELERQNNDGRVIKIPKPPAFSGNLNLASVLKYVFEWRTFNVSVARRLEG